MWRAPGEVKTLDNRPDHAHGSPIDSDGFGACQKIIVCADGLEIGEQVERVLAIDFEGEVGAERERLGVQSKLQIGRPVPPPTDEEVGVVLARIAARVQRLLKRRGLDPGDADLFQTDPVVDESPALAGISSASIQGRIALGPRAGARV